MTLYLPQDDPKLIEDIIQRKEFYIYKRWNLDTTKSHYIDIIPRFLLDDAIKKSNNLRLMSYQHFVKNYMNPNTPYQRLLIKWQTGTGKSIGALSIAMNFIQYYKLAKETGQSEIGTVFIIGFSERIFKSELLRFPEFGFLSRSERAKLDHLKRLAVTGSAADIQKYQELIIKIKKRFSNRKGNGFFKFFGYKAFVNRIFISPPHINLNTLSEEEIRVLLSQKTITYNEELMQQFKNSLIICDEIHNVYNSVEKNNWGIAIQAVLDKEKTCRAVFTSATPLNNSPTEIVDLLNLLLPNDQRLTKTDLFINDKDLKPGALEQIAKLSRGRVSYLRDVNPQYYPKNKMIGEVLKEIPFLKFIRSPMSQFQYNTYSQVYTGVLPQDSQYLVDFVLENPDSDQTIGLFQTNTIKNSLTHAPLAWKNKYGLDFKDGKIIGPALKRDRLQKYSTKYVRMLDELMNITKEHRGKVFIYHNIVHMSGVLFIEQVLLQNGYLNDLMGPKDDTICIICGNTRKEHSYLEIHGSADYKKEINIIRQVRTSHRHNHNLSNRSTTKYNLLCYYYNKRMFTMKYNKKYFYILASDLNNSLIQGKSYALQHFSNVLNKIHPKQMLIQAPNYAPRFCEWLLQIGFKIIRQNPRYTIFYSAHKNGKIPIDVVNKLAGARDKYSKHQFIPARFIIIHSEIDKNLIEHNIEKFNNPDNTEGHQYMILIGSKIMKESHNIKAVQNVFIMGRPDNIPTLLQIRGRAIRKNSHKDLPEQNREVRTMIFTTCLPIKQKSGPDKGKYQLSYEEEKYKEKAKLFRTIQNIEKILHENAIDSLINYDLINRPHAEEIDPLEALPFTPNIPKKFLKEMPLSKLNTLTYDIYYSQYEISIQQSIIKRLFIELSSIWEYNNLFQAVKEDRLQYVTELNTHLFNKDYFNIALHQLTWNNDNQYIEPLFNKQDIIQDYETRIIDKLYDSNDKIISIPNGQDSIIVPVSDNTRQYYILFPINSNTNEPNIDIEQPHRIYKPFSIQLININNFIQTKNINFDYDDKKKLFYRKYFDVSIENMEHAICEYGTHFHIKFLEECIEYVFRAWTDPTLKMSEYHDFYFKMLYYYDLLSLCLWAYTAKPRVFNEYKKYAIPVKAKDIKLKQLDAYQKNQKDIADISPDDNSDLATSGVINLLKSSINRTSNVWIPKEFREQFNKTLEESYKLFKGRVKKNKQINKVSARLLPIGHFISTFPRIYHPEKGWTEDPTYVQHDQEYIENDIIIGYDEKSKNGTHVRFKIRKPIHNIKKYKDIRLIEKGTVCKSKSKSYLKNVAKRLGIELLEKNNVDNLCLLIRIKLIRLELKERIQKSKIKYFYFHYESPQTVV